MLSTEEGVDRAFKKLDTIKSQVVWWEAGAQPPQLLADGEVVMSSAWNGRIANAIKEGKTFKIVWDAQGFDYDYFAIPKGHRAPTPPTRSWRFRATRNRWPRTRSTSYGPVHLDAQYIAPDILKDLLTAPENTGNVLYVDCTGGPTARTWKLLPGAGAVIQV
jgi:putative spermidine/putrescine transport system substrate-binding protein